MPSAQSKPDANKADDTSPFALLVGSVQPKPAAPQKDTHGKDSQNSGEKQKDAGGAHQTDSATAQNASQAPAKPAKADKSNDKSDDKNKDKGSDSGDSSQLSANLQQIDPQTMPAVQMSAQQTASLTATNTTNAASDDDAGQDQPAVSAAGAAGVAASGQAKTQAGQPAQASGLADDQAASPASNQAAAQPAGQAASQPSPQSTNQPASRAAPQSTDQTTTQPAKAKPQANGANQDPVQQAAAQPDGVQQPAKPWQAKNQTVGDANTAKTDAGKTDTGKTDTGQAAKADDVKQAVTPAPVTTNDTQAKQDATLGNALPVIGGPQAQATQGNTAPTVAQNVHVSTPTPNMPALAVEIAAKSLGGAKQFDIRLDPPELGRVEVRLSIDATGKASAHLSADQPQTLDLLQKDAPSLTRALRDAGLDVSQNGLNFSLRQQSGDSGAGQGQNFGNGRAFTLSATSSIDASQASAAYSAPANGRLDIRV